MITAFILNIPAHLLSAAISLLPAGQPIPTDWIAAIYTTWSYINAFSFIVPVQTLLVCTGVAISVELALLGFKFFHWVITKIPFVG